MGLFKSNAHRHSRGRRRALSFVESFANNFSGASKILSIPTLLYFGLILLLAFTVIVFRARQYILSWDENARIIAEHVSAQFEKRSAELTSVAELITHRPEDTFSFIVSQGESNFSPGIVVVLSTKNAETGQSASEVWRINSETEAIREEALEATLPDFLKVVSSPGSDRIRLYALQNRERLVGITQNSVLALKLMVSDTQQAIALYPMDEEELMDNQLLELIDSSFAEVAIKILTTDISYGAKKIGLGNILVKPVSSRLVVDKLNIQIDVAPRPAREIFIKILYKDAFLSLFVALTILAGFAVVLFYSLSNTHFITKNQELSKLNSLLNEQLRVLSENAINGNFIANKDGMLLHLNSWMIEMSSLTAGVSREYWDLMVEASQRDYAISKWHEVIQSQHPVNFKAKLNSRKEILECQFKIVPLKSADGAIVGVVGFVQPEAIATSNKEQAAKIEHKKEQDDKAFDHEREDNMYLHSLVQIGEAVTRLEQNSVLMSEELNNIKNQITSKPQNEQNVPIVVEEKQAQDLAAIENRKRRQLNKADLRLRREIQEIKRNLRRNKSGTDEGKLLGNFLELMQSSIKLGKATRSQQREIQQKLSGLEDTLEKLIKAQPVHTEIKLVDSLSDAELEIRKKISKEEVRPSSPGKRA